MAEQTAACVDGHPSGPRRGACRVASTFILACLLGVLSIPSLAAVRVEYRTGRIFGLFMFATTIADVPSRPRVLGDIFRASPYNTPETQARIAEFKAIHRNLQQGVDFEGFPSGRPNGATLEQLFTWRTLDARDLTELRRTTQGLLPLAQQDRYFEILSSFEAIYDSLIWRSNETKLVDYVARFQRIAPEAQLDVMFDAAALFYGAAWPRDLPFTVALYPIPAKQGSTSAESVGSLETVAVLLDEEDLPGRFAVMFHEMCHSLYESQSAAFQREFESFYADIGTPHSKVAHSLINEALATAVGNGWGFEQVTGHRDETQWYADAAIDGFAKAISPLVTDYLTQGRTLDRAFARQSVEIFQAKFPDAPFQFDALFREIVLLTDGETMRSAEVRDAMRRQFRISSIYSSEPADGEGALGYVREQGATLIVAVGSGQTDQLSALETELPLLTDRLRELREETRDVLLVGTAEGRTVIVMKLGGPQALTRALDELKRIGRSDPSRVEWRILE